jgi:hypothetical protein
MTSLKEYNVTFGNFIIIAPPKKVKSAACDLTYNGSLLDFARDILLNDLSASHTRQ